MNWSLFGRLRGRANPRQSSAARSSAGQPRSRLRRGIRLEQLEGRALLAFGDLPFGAMPDDTGEYMLGDVRVNVVFMESDGSMTKADGSPADNGTITFRLPSNPTVPINYNYTPENWSNWTPADLANLRTKISSGLAWWQQTLQNRFPKAPDDALNFSVDWTYADNPVHTAYEPIARISDDFSQWTYDFLRQVGFAHAGGVSPDIRAFNNFTRQQTNSDWAFTIFVVNDLNDPNDRFSQYTGLGSFSQAFAFAGGQFMVVPASRPFETFAHETGHMFWGLDEYLDVDMIFNPTTQQWEPGQIPDEYARSRGYYNTPNLNAADNPAAGFVQEDSIMSNGLPMQRARDNHTSSRWTLEMVGWKDADNDGIMDVLDVPLELTGSGQYDISTGIYYFNGSTRVRTLPNQNPAGLRNDITLNQIRAIEYSVDGGVTWQRHAQTFPTRTYESAISINFPVPDGQTTVKIRTLDTRTGVKSNDFVGVTDGPAPASPGVSGFVFQDDDRDGFWDTSEPPLPDYGIKVLDESEQPLDLLKFIDPDLSEPNATLGGDGATLSAVGFDTGSSKSVIATFTNLALSADLVFGTTNNVNQSVATWNENRKLRIEFADLQSNVSLLAYGGGAGATFARFEAWSAGGTLLERITTGALSPNSDVLLAFNRPSADISYVLAYGHANTSVILDSLEWGPASSATSDTLGAYSLNSLPDGTYTLKMNRESPSHHFSTPSPDGTAVITIAGGMSNGAVNFGIYIETEGTGFHNFIDPLDVDGDTFLSPSDAILIINWLNANPGISELPADGDSTGIGYVDVDNDGFCSTSDAIIVINELNAITPGSHGGGGGGEGENVQESPEGETAASLASVQAAAESADEQGERSGPPRNAAEYFAQNPIHFDDIPGTNLPCSCAQCLVVQEGPAAGQGQLQSTLDSIAADISLAAQDELPRIARRLLTTKCE